MAIPWSSPTYSRVRSEDQNNQNQATNVETNPRQVCLKNICNKVLEIYDKKYFLEIFRETYGFLFSGSRAEVEQSISLVVGSSC